MRRLPVCPALLVTLLVFGGAPAEGQTASRFSVQASGLFVGVFGDAFEGVSSGGGFEVQARFNPSTFSIGLGYQSSIHDLEFEDEFGGTQTVDLDFAGPFIEPRYVIDIGSSSAAPYLAARIAFLKQTAEADFGGTVVELESSGTQLNIGGGVGGRVFGRGTYLFGTDIYCFSPFAVRIREFLTVSSIPGAPAARRHWTSYSRKDII
jgi:hypothetical protein